MMKIGHISVLLSFLLPLCTLIIGTSVKENDLGLYHKIIMNINPGSTKPGSCPPQRYYIKPEHEICHRLCMADSNCQGDMKCCPENCQYMCKPPAKQKPGECPNFESAFSTSEVCNDNCSDDAECPGTWKCCKKNCGKTCTPTVIDMAKPSTGSTASRGFCAQEEVYNCEIKERIFCDQASCIDGYKCCPRICRQECQKALTERAGECPASTECPSQTDSKACSSDYDCDPFFKCCATCGNRCVKAVHIPSFLHNGTSTIFINGGR